MLFVVAKPGPGPRNRRKRDETDEKDKTDLRVSAKDPFNWLYVTPAFTAIVNLDDHSWQIAPEIVYTGWQNMELRARALLLHGGKLSEFGEKATARRLELSLRMYF